MRKLAWILLLLSSTTWSANPMENPLYKHLLGEAQDLLAKRHQMIGEITDPGHLSARGEMVRDLMVAAVGALPERTPLNAKTVWEKDFGDHRVEGVLFESRPGFFVTANLYLPKTPEPPYPAVLGPCGHNPESKAEAAYQTCWINLARRGFAVLSYDPIGQGERMSYLDAEGKARFWGVTEHTILGVQSLLLGYSFAREIIWDGIRALDYLESRPDIDATRVGCSGNSGGGTQTAYLMALDKRIACAAPSCYITSLSRLFETIGPQDAEQNLIGQVAVGIDQADYVEACLPRPVLICCAAKDFFDIRGTWDTFREAKSFYGRAGLPERVDLIEAPDEHGYSLPRRTAIYHWMARWLMGKVDEAPEPPTTVHSPEELLCTKTGQVQTSLPDAKRLASIYAAELKELHGERKHILVAGPNTQLVDDLVERANIHRPSNLPSKELRKEQIDGGLTRSTWQIEMEPGWNLETALYQSAAGGHAPPVLWLEDAVTKWPDPRLGTPEEAARKGHPVLVLTPRGLADKSRLEGNELERYFGDWPTSFLALHLNRPILGQRVEDILAALDLLASQFPDQPVRLVANRESVPPALVAVLMDARISESTLRDGLVSWDSIFGAKHSVDALSNIVPGMLQVADLPDLVEAVLPRKITILSARSPEGDPLERAAIEAAYAGAIKKAEGKLGEFEIAP